jgi:hypothetical protein
MGAIGAKDLPSHWQHRPMSIHDLVVRFSVRYNT